LDLYLADRLLYSSLEMPCVDRWGKVNPAGIQSFHYNRKRFSEALSVDGLRQRTLDFSLVRDKSECNDYGTFEDGVNATNNYLKRVI
jgi:hypothetical protein